LPKLAVKWSVHAGKICGQVEFPITRRIWSRSAGSKWDSVFIDQRLDGVVIPFRLDAHKFRQKHAYALTLF